MRQLTKRFTSYRLAQYEKKTGKGITSILDIGQLEINKIANIVYLGNPDMDSIERAYDRIDEYLASDEDNTIMTAFFDLIDEFDKDVKLLKSCGINASDLKAQFLSDIEGHVKNTANKREKVVDLPLQTQDQPEPETETTPAPIPPVPPELPEIPQVPQAPII